MDIFFYQLALIGYILSMAGFFVSLFSPKPKVQQLSIFLFSFGFLAHTGGFICNWIQLGHFPIIAMKGSLSFMAWLLALVYLMLFFRFGLGVLGAFFNPLILVLMFLSRIIPGVTISPRPVFRSLWLNLHIVFSLLGDALLAVAFCAGVIYLLQEKQIKRKKITGISGRLPSLSFLDTLNYHALIVGFIMLTIGLVIGAVYAQWVRGSFWNWDAKEIWSVLTWLVYAILLHERLAIGWRGRRAAWLSIIGFGFLIFTFLGVNYFLKTYHSFR